MLMIFSRQNVLRAILKLKAFGSWLVRVPTPKVVDVQTARLLAALTLALSSIPFIHGLVLMIFGPEGATGLQPLLAGIIMFCAYLLNRRGYYQVSAAIVVGINILVPYAGMMNYQLNPSLLALTGISASGVLLASIFFPRLINTIMAGVLALAATIIFGLLTNTLFFFSAAQVSVVLAITALTIVYQYHRNVLERSRQAELLTGAVLEEAGERFRQLTEAIEEFLFLSSPDRRQIYYVSPGFEKVYGYHRQELYENPDLWMQAIYPDDLPEVINGFEKVARGENLTASSRIVRPDGQIRWIETRSWLSRDENGRPEALASVISDITERKQMEAEREMLIRDLEIAKELADESSRLKSEFLATMSHELRTPLNAIEGFTGIMLNKMGGTDYNEKTEDYLTRVRSSSKRLLSLINDFLDLSRIEAGRLELVVQPLSPAQLAARWQDEVGILAGKKGLAFGVSLDLMLPEKLYGDEEAISKVVLNLLSNAIKFTEKGSVKLFLKRSSNKTWDIIVEDTGIGIPPHAREFIFDEFRQVDQSMTRKYGGSGLGLAITQKYVRAMGGKVRVESELGKGSTFTVTLPLTTSM
ncbi:MAG: PAS domain-containing protein [Anaerolineae bacterium]|nr:PAS domain-containing protein [Anaerolineae bacterium]